jgi:hypothetical protein
VVIGKAINQVVIALAYDDGIANGYWVIAFLVCWFAGFVERILLVI